MSIEVNLSFHCEGGNSNEGSVTRIMKTFRSWRGAWAAIPTPFDANGSIDEGALQRHVSYLCSHKIDGIVAIATTGEGATLSMSEKAAVLEVVLKTVDGRVPVIAGTGTNDTRTTLEISRMVHACGVDGLLLVTPYYNKPNQEGMYRHFMTVADQINLPQMIYNVPGRTGCRCSVTTLGKLSRHERIVGTKDATADLVFASQTRMEAQEDFLLFSGDDGTVLPFISIGGVGAISVVANIAPEWVHDIITLVQDGELEMARLIHERMLPLFNALFSDTSPIPLKAMMSCMPLGYPGYLRLPLCSMGTSERDTLCLPFMSILKEIKEAS